MSDDSIYTRIARYLEVDPHATYIGIHRDDAVTVLQIGLRSGKVEAERDALAARVAELEGERKAIAAWFQDQLDWFDHLQRHGDACESSEMANCGHRYTIEANVLRAQFVKRFRFDEPPTKPHESPKPL